MRTLFSKNKIKNKQTGKRIVKFSNLLLSKVTLF